MPEIVFLNPRTCGIYKDGATRYKNDGKTGRRTNEIDNELIDYVTSYLDRERLPPGTASIQLEQVFGSGVLVPTYYDERYNDAIQRLLKAENLEGITIGDLISGGYIRVRGGHGSPSNDQRSGHIPYVKVSDIRGLRINTNPTNLVAESVAARFWRLRRSHIRLVDRHL